MHRRSWAAALSLVVLALALVLYLGWSRSSQVQVFELGAGVEASTRAAQARGPKVAAARPEAAATEPLGPTEQPPEQPSEQPSESSTIHGLVLEQGQPVAGATITCTGRESEQRTQSDADGAFHFEGLAPGQVDVRAVGPDSRTSRAVQLELRPGPQDLRLELEAGCDVSIDVRDSEERLIPEVEVYAARFASAEDMRRAEEMTAKGGPSTFYVIVDSFNQHDPRPPRGAHIARAPAANGLASLRALQPGAYDFYALSLNYGVLHSYVELCPPSGTTTRRIRFPVGTSIEGRVVDSAQKAIAGADVHAYFAEQRGMQIPTMAKTGQDGRFVVPHVKPGLWRLEASAPRYPRSTTELEVPVEGRRDLRLVLTPGRTIRGRVVDHSGRAAPKVWKIWAAIAPGTQKVMDAPAEALSDAEGRFLLENMERGGTYEVWATGTDDSLDQPRRSSARVRVGPGVSEVELRLNALGKVRGTVELVGGGTSPSCQVVGIEPVSCADGSFALELEPGEANLKAQADGYAAAFASVQVVEGQEVNVALRLERPRKLTVTVLDARTQRPLPGVNVHWTEMFESGPRARALAMEEPLSLRAKNLSDAQGRSIKDAPADVSYWVSASAPDYAQASAQVGGRFGDEVVLALEGAMLVSGDVVLPPELEGRLITSGLGTEHGHHLGGIDDHHFSHPIASSQVGHYRLLVRVELSENLAVMMSQPIEVPAGGLRDLRVVVPIGDASANFDLRGAVAPDQPPATIVLRSLDRPELSYASGPVIGGVNPPAGAIASLNASSFFARGALQFRQGLLIPGNYSLKVERWGQPTLLEQKVVLVAGQEAQIRLEK